MSEDLSEIQGKSNLKETIKAFKAHLFLNKLYLEDSPQNPPNNDYGYDTSDLIMKRLIKTLEDSTKILMSYKGKSRKIENLFVSLAGTLGQGLLDISEMSKIMSCNVYQLLEAQEEEEKKPGSLKEAKDEIEERVRREELYFEKNGKI